MLTTMTPKVSVLIPIYNAESFVADTISAVLRQSFKDFELILLNDASTDNTQAVISAFDDPRLVYAENKTNLGISQTRNRLIDMARGEYIAVLDHDDICFPDRLQTQVAFLDQHPDIAMVGSWFELGCPKTAPLWRRLLTNLGWAWCHPQTPQIEDLWRGNVMMHPTIMYRKKVFDEKNIRYREAYTPAEDYDLVRQALCCGLKLFNIPKILLKYNLHGGNLSITQKKAMQTVDHQIKTEIAQLLNKKPLFFYPYFLVMLKKLRLKLFLTGRKNV